jgi:predicted RNase H-like nuclease (RuvC/YqgF family)
MFVTKLDLTELMDKVQKHDFRLGDHDERLTNYEHRLTKLEEMIAAPMERIEALEKLTADLKFTLNNKVNVQDHYQDLRKKADINDLKALEASLIRLNELINDLQNQFADRGENDKAHKLLQKNLKNLYDLFMSMKGEGSVDDPMFTTKAVNCASCAKGVQNLNGFRADHVTWQNFPFKEPSGRMQKLGQGYSK